MYHFSLFSFVNFLVWGWGDWGIKVSSHYYCVIANFPKHLHYYIAQPYVGCIFIIATSFSLDWSLIIFAVVFNLFTKPCIFKSLFYWLWLLPLLLLTIFMESFFLKLPLLDLFAYPLVLASTTEGNEFVWSHCHLLISFLNLYFFCFRLEYLAFLHWLNFLRIRVLIFSHSWMTGLKPIVILFHQWHMSCHFQKLFCWKIAVIVRNFCVAICVFPFVAFIIIFCEFD